AGPRFDGCIVQLVDQVLGRRHGSSPMGGSDRSGPVGRIAAAKAAGGGDRAGPEAGVDPEICVVQLPRGPASTGLSMGS
ncbi:MAG TPA: hypothetical protein VJ482_05655, partial [Acidimicrobiia bacterium]|nr:hypothetical protein [Acidimicrobiia bacterium]